MRRIAFRVASHWRDEGRDGTKLCELEDEKTVYDFLTSLRISNNNLLSVRVKISEIARCTVQTRMDGPDSRSPHKRGQRNGTEKWHRPDQEAAVIGGGDIGKVEVRSDDSRLEEDVGNATTNSSCEVQPT